MLPFIYAVAIRCCSKFLCCIYYCNNSCQMCVSDVCLHTIHYIKHYYI